MTILRALKTMEENDNNEVSPRDIFRALYN